MGRAEREIAAHIEAALRIDPAAQRPSASKVSVRVDLDRGVIHVTVDPCPAHRAGACVCVERCALSSGGP